MTIEFMGLLLCTSPKPTSAPDNHALLVAYTVQHYSRAQSVMGHGHMILIHSVVALRITIRNYRTLMERAQRKEGRKGRGGGSQSPDMPPVMVTEGLGSPSGGFHLGGTPGPVSEANKLSD